MLARHGSALIVAMLALFAVTAATAATAAANSTRPTAKTRSQKAKGTSSSNCPSRGFGRGNRNCVSVGKGKTTTTGVGSGSKAGNPSSPPPKSPTGKSTPEPTLPTAPVTTPPVEAPAPTPPAEVIAPPAPIETESPLETTPEGSSGSSTTAKPSSIYWGAWIGSQLTGDESPWDMSAVSKFEGMAQKNLSIVEFGSPFSNCYSKTCSFYSFPTEPMQHIREHGSIPFLSWSSQSIPSNTNEPNYQLSDVANGTYDSYIRSYAKAAAAWGHPFFLRFDWEMNGNWFNWGSQANGNNAAEYVAAWRHVHDIFTEVGATNVSWVWCPNVDPDGTFENLAALYPGNEYVDWTGLDGYNWGTNPSSPLGWGSFSEIFSSTYNQIVNKIAPTKPMIIGETAATEYGGSKANWIKEALNQIPTKFPQIHGLLWFEKEDSGMDWPIETSSSATAAFASGIQNPAYTTNSYANLQTGGGPIPPPST
jgi:hypothetical protein